MRPVTCKLLEALRSLAQDHVDPLDLPGEHLLVALQHLHVTLLGGFLVG